MNLRLVRYVALPLAFAAGLAADDLFIGKWKLNPDKSKITGDTTRIEASPGGEYKFTSGETSTTCKMDGRANPAPYGRTRSCKQLNDHSWKFTFKNGAKVLTTETWELASDGQTMNVAETGDRPGGEHFDNKITMKRTGGSSGLAGSWQSTEVKLSSPEEFELQPWDGDGETAIVPAAKIKCNFKFDGKDYTCEGPNIPKGSATSGKKIDDRNVEFTDKYKGKVTGTSHVTLSEDGHSMTEVIKSVDSDQPMTLVYEKQ